MKNISFSVIYEEAPEGGYVAYVPALPGCHTQGETIEKTDKNPQVLKEIDNSIKDYNIYLGFLVPSTRRDNG